MKKIVLMALAMTYGVTEAQAGVILDFTTMPTGPVTTIGDATFSLAGVGEMGAPTVDHRFGGGLWNSTDGATYPTNTILRVDFAAPVNNVVFQYDAQGLNGNPLQGWTIYDSSNSVIAQGSFTYSLSTYNLTAYTGIARIDWHNGRNNWLSNLNILSYDPSESSEGSAVPEPASMITLAAGAIGMLGFRMRKRKGAAVVA